jgi:hypothetical protein
MRTSIHLPDDLLKQAKRKAAEDGRTLTSLLEEGLRLVLSGGRNAKPSSTTEKGRLPISRHAGGLRAGIDVADSADLQEREDLEYAERLGKGFE